MLELLDSLFDELTKRIKEAPGWLLLSLGTGLALKFGWIGSIANKLDVDVENEQSMIATSLAVALLALGDVLDSAVFPREQGKKRLRNIRSNSLLALVALALMWWLTQAAITYAMAAFIVAVLWVLFALFLGALPQWLGKANASESGWPVLKTRRLEEAQRNVRCELQIKSGIYSVSLGLTRKAEQYTFGSRLWLENEFGKFVRSLVFPIALVVVSASFQSRPLAATLAGAGAVACFCLYWRLKVTHVLKRATIPFRESRRYDHSLVSTGRGSSRSSSAGIASR